MGETKRCPKCGITKPLEAFHYSKRRKDGRVGYCRQCKKEGHRLRKYGLTNEQYEEMYQALRGMCPLCNKPYPDLVIDHCHQTGKVRGLLCNGCNRSLGYIEDPNWRKRALDYLKASR